MFWKMEAKRAMDGKETPAISGQIKRDLSKEVTFELRRARQHSEGYPRALRTTEWDQKGLVQGFRVSFSSEEWTSRLSFHVAQTP